MSRRAATSCGSGCTSSAPIGAPSLLLERALASRAAVAQREQPLGLLARLPQLLGRDGHRSGVLGCGGFLAWRAWECFDIAGKSQATEDFAEGVKAMGERRIPNFVGR